MFLHVLLSVVAIEADQAVLAQMTEEGLIWLLFGRTELCESVELLEFGLCLRQDALRVRMIRHHEVLIALEVPHCSKSNLLLLRSQLNP